MKKLTSSVSLQYEFDSGQVLYVTGDSNHCLISLEGGKRLPSCKTLKWHADHCPGFIRIHKGYLINPRAIYYYYVTSPTTAHVLMRDGVQLPIGRRRIEEVVNRLNCATRE